MLNDCSVTMTPTLANAPDLINRLSVNRPGRLFPVGLDDQRMNIEDIWPIASSLQTPENRLQDPWVVGKSPQFQSSSFCLQVAGEDGVPGLPGRREWIKLWFFPYDWDSASHSILKHSAQGNNDHSNIQQPISQKAHTLNFQTYAFQRHFEQNAS